MRTTTSEEVIAKLKSLRDSLLAKNMEIRLLQGDRWASGFSFGVEAMWEACEDAVCQITEDA